MRKLAGTRQQVPSLARLPASELREVEQRVKGLLRAAHRRVSTGLVELESGLDREVAAYAKAATVGPKLPRSAASVAASNRKRKD